MWENAPCKLFVEDLLKCRKTDGTNNWTLKLNAGDNGSTNLKIYMVWIQGIIHTVIDNSDKISVLLNDGSGTAQVTNIGDAELAKSWISTGVYCSAIGYITKVAEVPEVHAIKMADLSHNPVYERIWPYEVKELRLVLLDLIKPSLRSVEGAG